MPILLDRVSVDTESKPLLWPATRDHSRVGAVEVKGSFGSGYVQIQGSTDQITWITLKDDAGHPFLFTANQIKLFQLPPGMYIRATLSNSNANTSNVSAGVY